MCPHVPLQIYAAPLEGSARAVVLLNLHHTGGQYLVSNITVSWEQLGLPAGASATVRDLYAEADLGVHSGSFTAAVTAHDVVALRITPLEGLASDDWRPWHQQPIYAEPVAAQAGEAAVKGSAGGAGRELAPGGAQHGMFAMAE